MPSGPNFGTALSLATEELNEFMTTYSGCLPWTVMNELHDIHHRMSSGYLPRPEDQAVILAAMMRVQRVNRYGK